MENYPDGIASIQIRERIVLPFTIQQYALLRINELNKESVANEELIKVRKIVTRLFLVQTLVEIRLI
jgi:phosphoenolpyruvate carboxylase